MHLQVHTKKRNRLEHQRLNKLVYVSSNRKMDNRFVAIRELGSKGKRSNPLALEEFMWENEWVQEEDDNIWAPVDECLGASQSLRGRNLPRAAAAAATRAATSSQPNPITYRSKKRSRTAAAEDLGEDERETNNQEATNAPDGQQPNLETNAQMEEEESEACEVGAAADGFQLDQDLI